MPESLAGAGARRLNLKYEASSSQLLTDYRNLIHEAVTLGDLIQEVYGVNPPTVRLDGKNGYRVTPRLARLSTTYE